ncbi:MAG: hypothetical protein JJ921_02265 [Pseudomonadales bacterium]|nr:hypothetical protein [Pseudomonadales bacterium]
MLTREFSIDVNFDRFCRALSDKYDLYRAGIVRADLIRDELVMISQWYADGRSIENPKRRMDRQGTVGNWVLKSQRSFVGRNIDDVRNFPSTFDDFDEEELQSNIVEFIDHERSVLFFALSQSPDAFVDNSFIKENLPILLHCIELDEHFSKESYDDALQTHVESCISHIRSRFDMVPTQEQFNSAYYRTLLLVTRGRIDGPNGAARLAGVNTSTFRSRLARFRGKD